jgi:RNA polymerase-associated protein
MGVIAKRSSMSFFSDGASHYSHRVRIVLAEKGVTVDIIDVDTDYELEELVDINPYNSLPTLVDRDLVLYQSNVMMEYLDERFPHPPLLPVYPVARAESRLLIYRIERDWCRLVNLILRSKDDSAVAQAQQELKDGLIAISPILAEKDYFMSEDFTLVDCCIAPILWRLSQLGITLPSQQAGPMLSYMARLFARDSFQESLSETEREMHL